jgi:S-methylmethionine-dependent homocysteine/selenocysteine methylase
VNVPTPRSTRPLPQPGGDIFLTDGGLETTLVFLDGFELPDFAAFPLLRDPAGRAALVRYFESYLDIARRDRVGIVLETPTWRANSDWGARLGLTSDELSAVNRDAVEMLLELRGRHESPDTPIVVSGCVGPRGDGYQVSDAMTADDARAYHSVQATALADAGADVVTAITMTYADEATGVAEASRDVGLPAVISFTVETDGRLPSGEPLGDAIDAVDAATDGYPKYFMINCAHPTHFAGLFDARPSWACRLGGLRANASALSHAELDEAEELDRGDPLDLAQRYRELRDVVPSLSVLGGCCGTDHHHIAAISRAMS